jgi:UDP-glucose 4-epimerase
MKTALVTGGAGFIGSHIADAYLARGWRVVVVDDLSTGDKRNVDRRAELYVVDIRDAASLIGEIRPDLVNHHAAQIDVRRSVVDPADDADINIVGSIRLLQASLESGVKRFIFASSGGAGYGEPLFTPQTEEHPIRPMSPYGCAKVSVENYMNYFREVHGLSTVALRYANVYGPRQNTKGEAGVIAIFADRMLRGEPVTINGSGDQTRDFVFVRDVVAANMAVTEHSELTGSFNVGTGVETSINTLYEEMAKILETAAAPIRGPAKAGEQMRSVLDGSLLRNAGGLGPFAMVREGLRETIDFFRHPQ